MLLELLLSCTGSVPPGDSQAEEPSCPELSGFGAEAEQDWGVHADSPTLASGSWTRSIHLDGEAVQTVEQGQLLAHDGNEARFEDRRSYRCDEEGLWWLSRELWLEVDSGGQVTERLQLTEWELPPLLLPVGELQMGDSWEGVERYVITVNGEPDAPIEQAYTVSLDAWLWVTVPAGTFESFQWRKGDRVEFLSAGTGRVRDEDGELL